MLNVLFGVAYELETPFFPQLAAPNSAPKTASFDLARSAQSRRSLNVSLLDGTRKQRPCCPPSLLATASEFLLALDLIGCARLIGRAEKLLDRRIQFGRPNGF